jgi:hypothetical protein
MAQPAADRAIRRTDLVESPCFPGAQQRSKFSFSSDPNPRLVMGQGGNACPEGRESRPGDLQDTRGGIWEIRSSSETGPTSANFCQLLPQMLPLEGFLSATLVGFQGKYLR